MGSDSIGLLNSYKNRKWSTEWPDGPYYACDVDGCTSSQATQVCQEMGGRICEYDEMQNAFDKTRQGATGKKWDSCQQGWVSKDGNTMTTPYLWSSASSRGGAGADVLVSQLATEGASGVIEKSKSSDPINLNCGTKHGANKGNSETGNTSGVFCCKENAQCQTMATEFGTWVKDGKIQHISELDFEYNNDKTNVAPFVWDLMCSTVTNIQPKFSDENYLSGITSVNNSNPGETNKSTPALRQAVDTQGWWDVRTANYYTEKYFVNAYGLKQKINTDNIISLIKGTYDSDMFEKYYLTLDQLGQNCAPQYVSNYVGQDIINSIEDGVDINSSGVGCGFAGKNITYNDNYAWVDTRGMKHIFENENIYNQRNNLSCPTEIVEVSGNIWDAIPEGSGINTTNYICQYISNELYDNVTSAYNDVKNYAMQLDSYISNISDIDGSSKTKLTNLQNNITIDIQNINNNINKIDRLKMLSSTVNGKSESSNLRMKSNRMQLIIWAIIAIILLIYSINSMHGEIKASPLNISMLVVCTVIFFMIAMKMYETRIL